MTEDQLYNLSDEELETLMLAEQAELNSPETEIEEESQIEDEIIEDEITKDLEQPEEDSDDDAETEEDEVEEVEEKVETEEVVEDESESKKTEETTETKEPEPVQTVQKRKYKANGKEYEFTDDEIFAQFGTIFGQSMNYTQKMQAMKPDRKMLDAIKTAGLKHEDINLAIDVLKGDKNALTEIIKKNEIDPFELNVEENEYQAKDYGRSDVELEIKEVVDEISVDPEYNTTQNILADQWDAKSWEVFENNPKLIKELHIDVKSGTFDKVKPIMDKLKVYDGGNNSDLNYYMEAAKIMHQEDAQAKALEQQRLLQEQNLARTAEVKQKTVQRKATQQKAKKRKAAAPVTQGGKQGNLNYFDDSEEAFEAWYASLDD